MPCRAGRRADSRWGGGSRDVPGSTASPPSRRRSGPAGGSGGRRPGPARRRRGPPGQAWTVAADIDGHVNGGLDQVAGQHAGRTDSGALGLRVGHGGAAEPMAMRTPATTTAAFLCFISLILSAVVSYARTTVALRCQLPVHEHPCSSSNDWVRERKPLHGRELGGALFPATGTPDAQGECAPDMERSGAHRRLCVSAADGEVARQDRDVLRMCDSGSSPLAWVEFSVHCWFCGADRT